MRINGPTVVFLSHISYSVFTITAGEQEHLTRTVSESPKAAMTLISAAFTSSTGPEGERKDGDEK